VHHPLVVHGDENGGEIPVHKNVLG
jgi:hypothetical protein